MFPTRVWNSEKNCYETNGTYSHVSYDGEVQYDHTQKDGLGRPTKILPTLFLNTPFEDELKFVGFSRGRSAAGGMFTNAKGQNFYMFLTDLSDAVPFLEKGVLKGTFKFVKRGSNFGVQMQ